MNKEGWTFFSAERMGWQTWPRRRRLKFIRRCRANGHGDFLWFSSETVIAISPTVGEFTGVIHARYDQ